MPSTGPAATADIPPNYKWIVLSNTTIGMLLATINSSILLAQAAALTGRSFFPTLMGVPFSDALSAAFTFSFIACLIAAAASWMRGGKYHYGDEPATEAPRPAPAKRVPGRAVSR